MAVTTKEEYEENCIYGGVAYPLFVMTDGEKIWTTPHHIHLHGLSYDEGFILEEIKCQDSFSAFIRITHLRRIVKRGLKKGFSLKSKDLRRFYNGVVEAEEAEEMKRYMESNRGF